MILATSYFARPKTHALENSKDNICVQTIGQFQNKVILNTAIFNQ